MDSIGNKQYQTYVQKPYSAYMLFYRRLDNAPRTKAQAKRETDAVAKANVLLSKKRKRDGELGEDKVLSSAKEEPSVPPPAAAPASVVPLVQPGTVHCSFLILIR